MLEMWEPICKRKWYTELLYFIGFLFYKLFPSSVPKYSLWDRTFKKRNKIHGERIEISTAKRPILFVIFFVASSWNPFHQYSYLTRFRPVWSPLQVLPTPTRSISLPEQLLPLRSVWKQGGKSHRSLHSENKSTMNTDLTARMHIITSAFP